MPSSGAPLPPPERQCQAHVRGGCNSCGLSVTVVGIAEGACQRCGSTDLSGPRQCHKWAIQGAAVCDKHGGRIGHVKAAAAQRVERAKLQAECDRLGIPVQVDPGEALLGQVWEAAGNVEFYATKVAELREDLYVTERGPAGAARTVPHAAVVLYNEERDRLASMAARAIHLGLEERRVRLAESQARKLFGAVAEALRASQVPESYHDGFRRALASGLRAAEESRAS